jgi:hypothetical protein
MTRADEKDTPRVLPYFGAALGAVATGAGPAGVSVVRSAAPPSLTLACAAAMAVASFR